MKKIYGILGAAVLMTFVGCSDNTPDGPDVAGNAASDAHAQVRISMANVLGSRETSEKGQFGYGSDDENAVKDILLVFYNNSGQVVGTAVDQDITTSSGNTYDNNDSDTNNDHKDGIAYTATVSVDLGKGFNASDATQVMAFINFTKAGIANYVNGEPINKLKDVTFPLSTVVGNSTVGMPMSNSLYKSTAGVTITAADCSGKIYEGETAPEDYEAMDIYVERLAAKVQLVEVKGIESVEVKYGNNDKPFTLEFQPTAWNVLGVAKNSYAVKNLSAVDDWMNGPFRTYWAEGVGYSTATQNNFILYDLSFAS